MVKIYSFLISVWKKFYGFLIHKLWNNILLFLSIIIVIWNYFIEKNIIKIKEIDFIVNKIFFWIALSYISSYVFYLIIDYFPKKIERKKIQPHIDKSLKKIFKLAKSPFNQIVKDIDFLSIKEIDIQNGCKESKVTDINVDSSRKVYDNDILNAVLFTKIDFIINSNEYLFKEIKELLNYLPYLDGNIVQVLSEILDSEFISIINSAKIASGLVIESDFSCFDPLMYKYYKIVKKLCILIQNQ